MFIKWRTYQRQKGNQKGDKYFLQPILVKSYRPLKKQFKEFAKSEGISAEEFREHWKENNDVMNRPRHFQIYRFPSFPSCAYVYYEKPAYIEQRKHYWEMLELILNVGKLSWLLEGEKEKIRDEIESILPKPDDKMLTILEMAYQAGMPKDLSPLEYANSKGYV